jgi:hypothetical protein
MYCSTCGNQIADHLNYCNSCGTRIEKNPLVVSNSSSTYLARSLPIVGGFGFLGFIAVLKILLDNPRLDASAVVFILVAYLIALFLICAMMIGHIWKHSGDIRVKPQEPRLPNDYVSPASFRSATTAQLEEAREPAISVTEHTTRTLDEVPLRK